MACETCYGKGYIIREVNTYLREKVECNECLASSEFNALTNATDESSVE